MRGGFENKSRFEEEFKVVGSLPTPMDHERSGSPVATQLRPNTGFEVSGPGWADYGQTFNEPLHLHAAASRKVRKSGNLEAFEGDKNHIFEGSPHK